MKNVNIEKDLKDVCKLVAHTQIGLEYLDKYDVFKLCISSLTNAGEVKLVKDFCYTYITNPYTAVNMYTKDELIKIYIAIKFGPQIAGLTFKDLNVEYNQIKLFSEIADALKNVDSLKYGEENKNDIDKTD